MALGSNAALMDFSQSDLFFGLSFQFVILRFTTSVCSEATI